MDDFHCTALFVRLPLPRFTFPVQRYQVVSLRPPALVSLRVTSTDFIDDPPQSFIQSTRGADHDGFLSLYYTSHSAAVCSIRSDLGGDDASQSPQRSLICLLNPPADLDLGRFGWSICRGPLSDRHRSLVAVLFPGR